MSSFESDHGAGSKMHFDAYAKLKSKLRDLNIVDYDPMSYTPEESFRKQYELWEIQIAFEEYLLQTKAIKLVSNVRENWAFAIKVKFPLNAPAYAGLLPDEAVTTQQTRSDELSQLMIVGGYIDPITGLRGNHPNMANTAAQRKIVTEELSSIQNRLQQHYAMHKLWRENVVTLNELHAQTDIAVDTFLSLFCISIRDVCRPSAASTTTTLSRGIFLLDNLLQPLPVAPPAIIPIPLVNPFAPLQDFFATLAEHAAAVPHGHTVTNPNMPTPDLIERLVLPMTPVNAADFQESTSIRIGKTVYLLAINMSLIWLVYEHLQKSIMLYDTLRIQKILKCKKMKLLQILKPHSCRS